MRALKWLHRGPPGIGGNPRTNNQTPNTNISSPLDPLLLTATGYAGLLATSFLAATLLPLSSEALIVAMAAGGFAPTGLLLVATVGNVSGSVANYLAGRLGRRFFMARRTQRPGHRLERAERVFHRWGSPALFFAWTPFIGDPLTVVAGVLRVALPVFLFWVTLGKGLRYALLLVGVDIAGGG